MAILRATDGSQPPQHGRVSAAFAESRVEELPNLGRREKATARTFAAFVIERDGKFLVRQRPAGVVNAHLWEFPNAEIGARPNEAYARLRAAAQLVESGRRAQADEQLQKALAFWRSVGATRYIREGKTLLTKSA